MLKRVVHPKNRRSNVIFLFFCSMTEVGGIAHRAAALSVFLEEGVFWGVGLHIYPLKRQSCLGNKSMLLHVSVRFWYDVTMLSTIDGEMIEFFAHAHLSLFLLCFPFSFFFSFL